jgi:hypothetical protein
MVRVNEIKPPRVGFRRVMHPIRAPLTRTAVIVSLRHHYPNVPHHTRPTHMIEDCVHRVTRLDPLAELGDRLLPFGSLGFGHWAPPIVWQVGQ